MSNKRQARKLYHKDAQKQSKVTPEVRTWWGVLRTPLSRQQQIKYMKDKVDAKKHGLELPDPADYGLDENREILDDKE